jgi:hypothetical protein
MKPLAALLLAALPLATVHAEEVAPPLRQHDLLSWPRVRADRFGCFLETAFHHKDPRFHCEKKSKKGKKKQVRRADPCQALAGDAGPAFPATKVREVHPLIKTLELQWERGEIQTVRVTLDRRMATDEVFSALELPPMPDPFHANVMDVTVEDCGAVTCVVIQGFDRVGAEPPECGR